MLNLIKRLIWRPKNFQQDYLNERLNHMGLSWGDLNDYVRTNQSYIEDEIGIQRRPKLDNFPIILDDYDELAVVCSSSINIWDGRHLEKKEKTLYSITLATLKHVESVDYFRA